jgi:glycosyltransferase involved in cell wall biosynthesis
VKVLVVASDKVGSSMAGPAIRALWFARELSKRFDVTLSVPYETDLRPEGFELVVENPWDAHAMSRLATRFDALVAQRLPVPTLRTLARSGTRTVYDLYDPVTIENLALDAGRRLGRAERAYFGLGTLVQRAVLAHGDAFVCASEQQRDLWLGALLVLGRVDHDAYEADPTLRGLIDVVPFGLDPEPPAPGAGLRDTVPGIGEGSRILLWPGGIWNWFDPLTVIRAVAELRRSRDDVWLAFLGTRHPNELVPEMEMTGRAFALAEELGVRGRGVHFNEGWVPFGERGAYLLEADLGVSAHFDDLEAHFAFRTRLLDCFWAGLPVVTTGGDSLGQLVAERGLGRTVAPRDVAGWSEAIATLLDDEPALAAMRKRLGQVREELAWPQVVEPLARLLAGEAGRTGRPIDPTLASYVARRLEYALAARGVLGAARRVAAIVAEQAVRRRRRRRAPLPSAGRSADDE